MAPARVQVAEPSQLQQAITDLSNASKSYDPSPGGDGYNSRMEVIAKAKEVIRMMTDPSDIAMQHVTTMQELVAIRTLLDLKVLQAIPATGAITLSELSKSTGVQESLLERLLRLPVATGFLAQDANLAYHHTKFSAAYAAFPGPGMYFQLLYDNSFLVLCRFHKYLRARGSFTEPDDETFCPYTWTHGQDGKTVWEIMAQDPENLRNFQAGLAHAEAAIPITGFYDFGQLKTSGDRTILVDVGGGGGQSIVQIIKAHPELEASKFVLQDLEAPIAQVEASGTLPEGVRAMGHNFFTPQPIKGAKAYYLRRIIHDFSDAKCIEILTQQARVMEPDSVVLIADTILPERISEADLSAAALDVTMLNMGGKERSVERFKQILEPAGLELVKVHRAGFGVSGLVEGRLKR